MHCSVDADSFAQLLTLPCCVCVGCCCRGVYYSFTSPPHLDVAVRPLGLPLPSVVPGVDTALRGVLNKLISRRLVEPQRRYIDIHRIYMNKHIARVGPPHTDSAIMRQLDTHRQNLTES